MKPAKDTFQVIVKFLITFTLIFALTSCQSKNEPSKLMALLQDSDKIISTRPQNQTMVMAIVKLKNPALFQTAQRQNNLTIVDSKLEEAILTEQKQTLDQFKLISPEIQVIYRYKYVLNGLCILAPVAALDQLKQLGTIASWERVGQFNRPEIILSELKEIQNVTGIDRYNSSKFIGADKLNQLGLTGKGIKVGVIDTGIDYTHAMFKGIGTAEAYKNIDPSKESTGFPSEKIVGGIDLVGTHYDSASSDFATRIPRPDVNPLDEAGHGTHVAGTIAGFGDGVSSYNGMAPDASLYAIKVFGADGSTSDMVVIAGLEYAADPNGDGDLKDQLDIVNLSLGSGYGNPKILYAEALKNLTQAGTLAVISAGNSGNKDYIVGAPGTSTESLSVAASIDDGLHNWQFPASVIQLVGETVIVEAIEAATTRPVADTQVSGEIYYIGLGNKELTEEQKNNLKGKVALLDRGVVTFNDKVKIAAENGAIGVIVANNREGDAFAMGTTDKFEIPAIMINQSVGQKIKAEILAGRSVVIQFKSEQKINKPELIDTITDFSSKGPRSIDGFLKPEISAPGSQIISAAMGGGDAMVKMSGTSMAAPHIAGVIALLKQAFSNRKIEMSASELKNVAMGTAKTISAKSQRYPVTRQGSGRVQADVAALAEVVVSEPSISFGEVSVESKKTMRASIRVRNLSREDKSIKIDFNGNQYITMSSVQTVKIKAESNVNLNLTFTLDATQMGDAIVREMDGFVLLKLNDQEIYRVPVLAVAHKLSDISSLGLTVSSSRNDSDNAASSLILKNNSVNTGQAILFNYLGQDDRKPVPQSFMNSDCDLQSVGYRIIEKNNEVGDLEKYVQFAVKTYKPMTTWNSCDISILIDSQKNGHVEQEILGANTSSIPGSEQEVFQSTLIDTVKARELRKAFENAVDQVKDKPEEVQKLKDQENYDDAILDTSDFANFNNSTIVIVEARISKLKVDQQNNLNFKVVVTHNEQGTVQMDDYLESESKYFSVSIDEEDQSFIDMSASDIYVKAGEQLSIDLTKGRGNHKLMVLLPQNKFSFSNSITDAQVIIELPEYKP